MSEWIKKLWQSPMISGSQTINHLASGVVGSILNRCGKLFFDLDSGTEASGETIAFSEVQDDKLVYHLHDLALKKRDQTLANNSIRLQITSGSIDGCVLEIPWKSLFTEETVIRVGTVKINLAITQPVSIFCQEVGTSVTAASIGTTMIGILEDQPESEDLIAAYSEISSLVGQYLGKTQLFLETLQINLSGHDSDSVLILMGIAHKDEILTVENLVFKVKRRIQLEMRGIRFSYASRELHIKYLETRSGLFDYPNQLLKFPLNLGRDGRGTKPRQGASIPLSSDPDLEQQSSSCSLTIEQFKHEGLVLESLRVSDDTFSLKSIIFQDSTITNDLVLSNLFNPSSPAVLAGNEIVVVDGKKLASWLKKITSQMKSISQLLVFRKPNSAADSIHDPPSPPLLKLQSHLKLIWEGNVTAISFQSLTSSSLEKVRLTQGDLRIQAETVSFDSSLSIESLSIRKDELSYAFVDQLSFTSDTLSRGRDGETNLATTKKLTINRGRTESLLQLIEFLSATIDYFRALLTEESFEESSLSLEEPESDFLLEFHNSSIIHPILQGFDGVLAQEKVLLTVEIKDALCSMTHKLLHHLETDFTLSREVEGKALIRRIGSLQASQSEASVILIDSLILRIDPILFDQINYYLGSLERTPEWSPSEVSEDALRELQQALRRSTSESLDVFMRREQQIMSASRITANSNLKSAYLENLSRKIDDLQLSVVGLQPRASSVRKEVKISSCQILLHDELLEAGQQTESFIRISIKDISLVIDRRKAAIAKKTGAIRIIAEPKKRKPNWIDQYHLVVGQLAVVDQSCGSIDWKYLISFAPQAGKALEIKADIHGDVLSTELDFSPISLNIREETMIRFLAFINSRSSLPSSEQPMMVESFKMSSHKITLSYYPMIADSLPINTLLSLRNHLISLKPRNYQYLDGFEQLLEVLRTDIIAEVNPTNYYQFLPSLGLTKPCAEPVSQIISVWNCYLSSDSNRRKLRALTRQLGKGVDMLSEFFQDKKLHDIIKFFSSG